MIINNHTIMKKFSKVSGVTVNTEPKIETQSDKDLSVRNKIISLMDQFLTVRTYGPVDRYQRAGLIKIGGKEMLAEAIIDLIIESSNKSQIKLLEQLKIDTGDWKLIDDKIDSLTNNQTLLCNRNKFNSLLEKYQDENLLIEFVQHGIDKIENKKTLIDYITLIHESALQKSTKLKLISIYTQRLNQID